MKYLTVEITTTQKCNMNCSYCFEGEELKNNDKQVNIQEIISALNELRSSDKFKELYDEININFWGGEPTLAYKECCEIIDAYKDTKVNFFFYTNGYSTFGVSKILDFYKSVINDSYKRISLQISYDGITNDIYRVDHNNKGTSHKILEFIKYMNTFYPSVNIKLKSVVLPNQIKWMVNNWTHFKELFLQYPRYNFKWAPTLEYTNHYNITEEDLKLYNTIFLKIAKLEIEFYEEYGHHLLTWFDYTTGTVCSAGTNILNIDLKGNILVCHGALYSKNKDSYKMSNIFNINYLKDYFESREEYSNLLNDRNKNVPEKCQGCDATVCYQCPIVSADNSKKSNNIKDNFYDIKIDLCEVYKCFGRIHQTVNKYLRR